MNHKALLTKAPLLLSILALAMGIKWMYRQAPVDDLRWMLHPTQSLVSLFTGTHFEFESGLGYKSTDQNVLIDHSCAGLNFWAIAFCAVSFGLLFKLTRPLLQFSFLLLFFVISFGLTVLVNSFRIVNALFLHQIFSESSPSQAATIHEMEGILIYFSFLLIFYWLVERFMQRYLLSGYEKTI